MKINDQEIAFYIDAYEIITRNGGRYYCNGKGYTDSNGKYHFGSVTEFKRIFAKEIAARQMPYSKSMTEGCGACIRDSVKITIDRLLKDNIITKNQLDDYIREKRDRLHKGTV